MTRADGQYARVNTETGELDTVRHVDEPSSVVQAGANSAILTRGNSQAWPVDPASPQDFTEVGDAEAQQDSEGADRGANAEEQLGSLRLPEGTREVVAAGHHLLIRTESGAAHLGTLQEGVTAAEAIAGGLTRLELLDPHIDDAQAEEEAAEEVEPTTFVADAAAIDERGRVALYSAEEGTITRFDAETGEFVGKPHVLPEDAHGLEDPELALVEGAWMLLSAQDGWLWGQGQEPVHIPLVGRGLLQGSTIATSSVYIADQDGLWSVQGGQAQRELQTTGEPARPVEIDGRVYGAWLGQQDGLLWNDSGDQKALTFDPSVTDPGELQPVFRTNGSRAVLSETGTGMLWRLPGGQAIPLAQWSVSQPPKEDRGSVVVNEVSEQVPPTAVDDAFGLRAGQPTELPVLLNDYDANRRDILTIVPDSIGESALDPAFGEVHLLPDAQSLTVVPTPEAEGSATFTYRITDGMAVSEAATVTLTAVDDEVNTAPDWCLVDGCQRQWQVPAIVPGGTLVYPILEGWVDPEGDPIILTGAEVVNPEDPARAIITSNGLLALSHTDPSSGAGEIAVRVTVQDARGQEQQRNLQVPIEPDAPAQFIPSASTIPTDEPVALRPLDRVAGGSGSFELLDATMVSEGTGMKVAANASAGTITVTAQKAESAVVSIVLIDAVTEMEFTGLIRITAAEGGAPLALPPLKAFVRPLADSTLEVLEAIPNSNARGITVQHVKVLDGDLRADVLDHSKVRVSGNTPDGRSGRVGSAEVVVTDGLAQATTRLTVFQVPDTNRSGAIAVPDAALVRAGDVVEIPVLDNDIAPPGERLNLHPEIVGTGTEGELAFASGNVLRYLAPEQPGTYRLRYTTYPANSGSNADVGTVTVTVMPRGSNSDPTPPNLTMRVSPGEQSEVDVPLSGIDPDGDRVRLVGVESAPDPQLSVSINANGDRIQARALDLVEEGVHTVTYAVEDRSGAHGTGMLRIIVTPPEDERAPIAATDHLRILKGAASAGVVRPLDNDLDPADGELRILSVAPNLPGGDDHPDYAASMDRLNLDRLEEGIVEVDAAEEIGATSYTYTVKSSASGSTSDGLLVVHTAEQIGPQAPRVRDTVLSVHNRATLETEGIDVVTDRVRWDGGDAATLRLSLWEESADYRVEGDRIVGKYKPEGDIVVFELSGEDPAGQRVTTYGLLIIPSLDDLRITLRTANLPLRVKENESIEVPVRDVLDLGGQDEVELREEVFPTGRAQATCRGTATGRVVYDAGGEAPWNDTCRIEVRLVGQQSWTTLPLPVVVEPREPAVELAPMVRTVDVGATETIDLLEMVRWEGERAGDLGALNFTVAGDASIFVTEQVGSTLTVTARADAEPGAQRALSVSVFGQGEATAALTLRVGSSPPDTPRGGTVPLRCEIGTECSARVIGVSGEHDPFAGRAGGGLTLESVNPSSCSYGEVTRVDGENIRVSWPDATAPGGTCTVGFTVSDAQGRLGEGRIELEALGLPRAPSNLTWTDYSEDSATLMVELGAAQDSYPAVSGVEISGPGNSSCVRSGASYVCTVSGLSLGSQGEYSARVVNSVGHSEPTRPVSAWAYAVPAAPELTIEQKQTPNNTDPNHGTVTLSARSGPDAGRIVISWGKSNSRTIDSASGTIPELQLKASTHTFSAVAESRFEVPPIKASSPRGNETVKEISVIGAPAIGGVSLVGTGDTTAKVEATGVTWDGPAPEYAYGLAMSQGSSFTCSQGSATFTGLERYMTYVPKVCVTTPYGRAEAVGEPVRIGGRAPALPDHVYRVGTRPVADGGAHTYRLENTQPVTPTLGPRSWVEYNTGEHIVLDPESASPEQIQVRQCKKDWFNTVCSDWATMGPASGTAPTTVVVRHDPHVCIDPADPDSLYATLNISSGAVGAAELTALDEPGRFRLRWTGAFSSLEEITFTSPVCPEPEPDPDPDPDPEPDPDPDPEPDPDPDPEP